MKVGDLENIVKEVIPFHDETLEPVYHRVRVPFQTSLRGFGFYPSASKKISIMGLFYEVVNKGIYGGRLNDKKLDIEFLNGSVAERSIKPDVIDEENKIHWESKGTYFNKECEIMDRQIEGYKFLQYSKNDVRFLFSIYRHSMFEIKKRDRTEEEIINGLLKSTIFSVILPLSLILGIQRAPVSEDVKLARNYISKNTNWPSCLCIRSHTINRFLIDPHENLRLLGFDPERFEIERYLSPKKLKMNGRNLGQFPILKIVDRHHEEWVEEFKIDYEREKEREIPEDERIEDLPIFWESEKIEEVPF